MKRLFFLALLIGAAGLAVYLWMPARQAPPEDLPASIRKLADGILQPIESKDVMPDPEATHGMEELTGKVAQRRGKADYGPSVQALKVLAQALVERRELYHRARAGSERTALDEVSGVWRRVDNDEVVDRPKLHHMERSSFWTGAELARWRERCVYYRSTIASLLARFPAKK